MRTRTRKRIKELSVEDPREATPTIDVSDQIDDFVPTMEVDPGRALRGPRRSEDRTVEMRPDQLAEWSSELLGLEGEESSAAMWLKKTANFGTSFPGIEKAPTPLVLPRMPLDDDFEPAKEEFNPLLDLDLDFSAEIDIEFDADLLALEEWSLNGLAPSTGAGDGPHSVADVDEAYDVIEVIQVAVEEHEAIDADALVIGEIRVEDDPAPFEPHDDPREAVESAKAASSPASLSAERPLLSAEDLRNELLRRLDLSPEEPWYLSERSQRGMQRFEDLDAPYDDVSSSWIVDDEPGDVPVARTVDRERRVTPRARPRPKPPRAHAPWLGRLAATSLFFGSGVATGSGAALLPIAALALVGAACVVVATPVRSRVWTVLSIGSTAGAFASWLNHVGILRKILSPELLGIWQSAAIGALALMLAWLLAAVLEASAD